MLKVNCSLGKSELSASKVLLFSFKCDWRSSCTLRWSSKCRDASAIRMTSSILPCRTDVHTCLHASSSVPNEAL